MLYNLLKYLQHLEIHDLRSRLPLCMSGPDEVGGLWPEYINALYIIQGLYHRLLHKISLPTHPPTHPHIGFER